MPLHVTTDHAEIVAALDRLLAQDPVRGTTLGTIRDTLEDAAWAAVDGERLAVRSSADYPVVVSGDWSSTALDELAQLLRTLPNLRGLAGLADLVDPLVTAVGRPPAEVVGQGLFRLDDLMPPVGIAGRAVRAGAAERSVVREWYVAFGAEVTAFGPPSVEVTDRAVDAGLVWLWLDADGAPVSMAARRAVVFGSARIGPVFTPPTLRGHGYGSAVTAAATRDILDDGGVPVLFTDLANPTSNKIYRQLGYRLVENRRVVMFGG